jgi:T4 RnlA family RNA ligase
MSNLYKGLKNLSDTDETFYFSDQEIEVNSKIYIIRSFSYRLASWSAFQLPYAKESRGTAFYVEKGKEDTDEWKLFCRAYKKFFNLGEGIPVDEYISKYEPKASYTKYDGSLILFGKIDGKVIAKSKTSINSDQAKLAQKLYDTNFDNKIKEVIDDILLDDYTPVFELVGPSNVIVLRYDNDRLVLLGEVDNADGTVLPAWDEGQTAPKKYGFTWDELLEIKETSKPDIEGFVVETSNNEFVKVKVNSYVSLHKLKDSVNNIKSLTEIILAEAVDDLIGSFQHDQKTIDYIVNVQEKISHKYNHLVVSVEDFYTENKELIRKDYAIKAQKEIKPIMGLVMDKYLGREPKYKEFFLKTKMYE